MSLRLLGRGQGLLMAGGLSPAAVRAARYGLVSAWNLDNLTDSYGTNTLTNVNVATFGTGKLGNAAYLARASNQALSVADNAGLSAGDNDSLLGIWMYLNDKTTVQIAATKMSGAQYEYQLYYTTSVDRFAWYVEGASATAIVTADAVGAPTATAWHLLVVYHDSVANLIGISVDGAAYETAALVGGARDTAGAVFFGRESGTTFALDGRLDAAVWCKSPPGGITALKDEIKNYLWNGGAGREYPAGWT